MHLRSPRAVLLWVAAAAVAIATALIVGGTLASLQRQDTQFGRIGPFVVARHDLELGMAITREDLTVVRARGGARPPGAIEAMTRVQGRVVSVPVLEGQAVTTRHLAARSRDGSDGIVAPGRRAMRITVDDAPRLRPGDHVDVFATFDPSLVGAEADPTLTVAEAVPVLAIDDDADDDLSATEGSRTAAVTLMVTARDAPRLAYATANGVLAVALVPPEDARRVARAEASATR